MLRLLTVSLLILLLACPVHASPPQYTIAQLFTAARSAPELKGARSFAENAVIVTPSYRVDKGMLNRFYFHPEYGRQIRELLEKDTFISWWQVDDFVKRNLARIHHVSLYEEGFILVQLENPQKVLLLPVSLVTVRRSEEAVKAYLKLQKP